MKTIVILLFTSLFLAGAGCNSVETTTYRNSDLPIDSVLTIGTYNVAWLGDGMDDKIQRSDADFKNIASIIDALDADILALQEIENVSALRNVVRYLDNYQIQMVDTEAPQDNAFLVKEGITVEELEVYSPINVLLERTRPGLLLSCSKAGFDFKILSVHFKSTSRYDDTPEKKQLSYDLRRKQSAAVNRFNDSLVAEGIYDFAVLGDFNDNPNRGNSQISELKGKLTFLTDSLTSCKNPNWDMIDHIALGRGLYRKYIENTLFIYNHYSTISEQAAYKVSDHCPVVASFWLGER
ncbi:MAG: endonuclease/exonuclease/phosphatase family protein [Candidatus Kapaibacteriales bacterium]